MAAKRPRGSVSARQVTLKDVADAAGVHYSTASRALDPNQVDRIGSETVARVRASAEALGYTPDLVAAGLKRGRSQTVGVIVPNFDNPHAATVIRGLSQVLEQRGFVTLVAESNEETARSERLLQHLLSRRVDAIVSVAAHVGDGPILRQIADAGIPVVLAVRDVPGSELSAVVYDDEHGARAAIDYLLGLGHRVLAQITGPLDIDSFGRRRQGFLDALAAVPDAIDVSAGGTAERLDAADGERLMKATLAAAASRPTAVFVHNDLMAFGALDAARQAGLRVPEDISIVGFNDLPLSKHVAPALTTVGLPTEMLGTRVGEELLAVIEDPGRAPQLLRLPVNLAVRESSGPPPAS
jgi:LacI family transcriptional regulator